MGKIQGLKIWISGNCEYVRFVSGGNTSPKKGKRLPYCSENMTDCYWVEDLRQTYNASEPKRFPSGELICPFYHSNTNRDGK